MFAHPWMVGRALEGDVEGHLHPEPFGGAHETPEILDLAKIGMHRRVASLGSADRPRAPGVARRRGERVVGPLAPRAAAGVGRRQVDDIEADAVAVRQPRWAMAERSAAGCDIA